MFFFEISLKLLNTFCNYLKQNSTVQSTPIMMQKGSFPLVPASECQEIWNGVVTITNRMQCVGGDALVSVCSVSLLLFLF